MYAENISKFNIVMVFLERGHLHMRKISTGHLHMRRDINHITILHVYSKDLENNHVLVSYVSVYMLY